MLDHGDSHGAEHALGRAVQGASGELLLLINEAVEALEAGDTQSAEAAIRQAEELLGIDGDGHADELDGDGGHGADADEHTEESGNSGGHDYDGH